MAFDPKNSICPNITSCKICTNNGCMWCGSSNKCHTTIGQIRDTEICESSDVYTLQCKFTNQTTAIAFLVFFSLLLLCAALCWCRMTRSCCYDRKRTDIRIQMEEAEYQRDREKRREEAEERRDERRKRMDVIRQKYGLAPKNPYKVMDDDA